MNIIETGAKQITNQLVNNGVPMPKDTEIVAYGLFAMLFTVFYCVLRKFAGGACKCSCRLLFTILAIAAGLITSSIKTVTHFQTIPTFLLSAWIVFTKAPVTYGGDQKSSKSIQMLKQKSRILIIMQLFILEVIHLLYFVPDSFVFASMLRMFVAAITLPPAAKTVNN